jgi:conjugative transfer signal peptidase TraF
MNRRVRQQRIAVSILLTSGLCISALTSALALGDYRINTTPSFPLGVWQIAPLDRPVEIGDTVFICLSDHANRFVEARQRGYLPSGLCASGLAPLIKTVVAMPGQSITVHGAEVLVDGVPLAHSTILARDGNNRPMRAYTGGIVPPDHVFLHSDFVASYDSRYFGPVAAKGILGLAKPVFTFAP